MDPIGVFIATLHQMLGHDTAAAFIGQPSGDRARCVLCQFEDRPDDAGRQAVIAAIGQGARSGTEAGEQP